MTTQVRNMELKEFIKTVIGDITNAVCELQDELRTKNDDLNSELSKTKDKMIDLLIERGK